MDGINSSNIDALGTDQFIQMPPPNFKNGKAAKAARGDVDQIDEHHHIAANHLNEHGYLDASHLDEEGYLNLEPIRIFELATDIVDVIRKERKDLRVDLCAVTEQAMIVRESGHKEPAKQWLGRIVRHHHERQEEFSKLRDIEEKGSDSIYFN